MRIDIERDTLGGYECWTFEVTPEEVDAPSRLTLTGYARFGEDGAVVEEWDYLEESEMDTAIPREAVPIPHDLADEARTKMLDQARLAIRAYVFPVLYPTA